jgi:hypothetical protein
MGESEESYDKAVETYSDKSEVTTSLGSLLKGIKLGK